MNTDRSPVRDEPLESEPPGHEPLEKTAGEVFDTYLGTVCTRGSRLEFCEVFRIGREGYVRCFDGEAYHIVPLHVWHDMNGNGREK